VVLVVHARIGSSVNFVPDYVILAGRGRSSFRILVFEAWLVIGDNGEGVLYLNRHRLWYFGGRGRR
jgi:hypothetical protein